MLDFAASYANNPARKGELAARKQTFGDYRRYAVAPVFTRFEAVQWFVWDAEAPDREGHPSIIRQEETLAAAVAGL
jgi:hypothetical protein